MNSPTILLVEDNRLLRWWLSRSLSRQGFVVVAPTTVAEALQLGTAYAFDILVSDWRLADGHDGFEVLATLRRAFPLLASILISGEMDDELTARALNAGFDRVLPKPLEISEIMEAIHSCGLWLPQSTPKAV